MMTWKTRLLVVLLSGVAAASSAFAAPTLSFTATPNPAVAGSTVGVDVNISGVSDLYAYQFSVSFNPSILQVTNAVEGPFLATGGATFFDGGTFDNVGGAISFSFSSLIGPLPGVSGAGVLVHYDFDVLQAGVGALTFSDVLFLDSNLSDIVVEAQSLTLPAARVPEPGSLALAGLGLAGLAAIRRRKQAERLGA